MKNLDDDDLLDIPSIVPARDEVASYRQKHRHQNTKQLDPAEKSEGSSWAVRLLLLILTLSVAAMAGMGYQFYLQAEVALVELREAKTSIAILESSLNAAGQSAEESSLSLIKKVNLNFSEIDKLWQVSNKTNKNNIRTNKNELQNQSKAMDSQTRDIRQNKDQLALNRDEIKGVNTKIAALNKNVATFTDTRQQLTNVNAEFGNLKSAISKLQSSQNDSAEEWESNNVWRLQINQTINQIQADISNLEEELLKRN